MFGSLASALGFSSAGSLFSSAAPIIGGALGYLGGQERNDAQARQADAANAFSAQQYASRYQTTVADMKAAGINPMLAYGSGPGQAPSGQQASVENASAAGVQASMASAQIGLLEAQAKAASAQAAKTIAETPTTGNLGDANLALLTQQGYKVAEEIVLVSRQSANTHSQGQVLVSTVGMLEQQAELMRQQGKTQKEIQEQLRAIVAKVQTEVDLNKLDLSAAKWSDNFGRKSNEFRLVADVLSDMVPNVGRLLQGSKKRGGWSTVERSDNKGNRSMETREWRDE